MIGVLLKVLECSWDELLRKVKDAADLDHIIAAHQEFLDAITTRSLLDSQSHVSRPLLNSQSYVIVHHN